MQTPRQRALITLRSWVVQFIMSCLYGMRALLGSYNSCRYEINCMVYAQIQLETQPFHRALVNIVKRVATCHPFRR